MSAKINLRDAVGFTGTRLDISKSQKDWITHMLSGLILNLHAKDFHHGDCIGADEAAAEIADRIGYTLHSHPPNIEALRAFYPAHVEYRPLGYLERNREIVDASKWVLAVPLANPSPHSGTLYTMRYARKMGVPLAVYPDTHFEQNF